MRDAHLDASPTQSPTSGSTTIPFRRAYDSGSLLAGDVVWSEVRAHFESDGSFEAAMDSLGVQYLPFFDEGGRLVGRLKTIHNRESVPNLPRCRRRKVRVSITAI